MTHRSGSRLGLVALAALTLAATGCGQIGPLAPMGVPAGAVNAFADFADIDGQIEKMKVAVDDAGTQVKQLPTVKGQKPVTFLAYKALDNNLGATLAQHLNTLEKAGSSTAVNAIGFTDDAGPGNTRRYYFRKDADFNKITSPYVPYKHGDGDQNTGSAAVLGAAIRWGFSSYPAKLHWLDVNNHGGGYYGIAQDDHTDQMIRLPQLASALTRGGNGRKLDVVSFDACLMATTEVAYELRDTAQIMVASEDSSYALGMNYDQTLAALAAKPQTDADDLARDLVMRSQRKGKPIALFTISAIDLKQAGRVTQAVDGLAQALIKAMPAQKATIKLSLNAVKAFHVAGPDKSDFDHRDLNEVVDQLRARVQDPAVQAACQAVKGTLFNKNGAILLSRSANEEGKSTRGLSIYLPTTGNVDKIYLDTSFAKATRWDEFLATLK